MRAVRQACGETFEEVHDFLKSEAFPVVLKPTDSGMWQIHLSLCHLCILRSHCSSSYWYAQIQQTNDKIQHVYITTAGSDGVKLCHSMEEAKSHFNHLLTVEAVNGGYNTQVLCQEFLRGKEYVVDHVSRKYSRELSFLLCSLFIIIFDIT